MIYITRRHSAWTTFTYVASTEMDSRGPANAPMRDGDHWLATADALTWGGKGFEQREEAT